MITITNKNWPITEKIEIRVKLVDKAGRAIKNSLSLDDLIHYATYSEAVVSQNKNRVKVHSKYRFD